MSWKQIDGPKRLAATKSRTRSTTLDQLQGPQIVEMHYAEDALASSTTTIEVILRFSIS